MNDSKKLNFKKLHGNTARIDATKPINPLFNNCAIDNYKTNRYGRLDNIVDNAAELGKKEVDDNPL